LEPAAFSGQHVLVVGGGNSAVETALALDDCGGCASVTLSYRRAAFARCRAENRRRIDDAIRAGKVRPFMPSDGGRMGDADVVLAANNREIPLRNDAVIVQIGGTAPAELLQRFGIDVVVKRGEI